MEFLAEYEFTVQYRPGTENTAVEILSRQTAGARAKVLSSMDEGDLALALAPEIEEPFEGLEPRGSTFSAWVPVGGNRCQQEEVYSKGRKELSYLGRWPVPPDTERPASNPHEKCYTCIATLFS